MCIIFKMRGLTYSESEKFSEILSYLTKMSSNTVCLNCLNERVELSEQNGSNSNREVAK